MRSQSRRGVIATTCSLSIALCMSIPAGPARPSFARATKDETRQPQKGDSRRRKHRSMTALNPSMRAGNTPAISITGAAS